MNGAEKLIKVMSDICKYEESKIILGTYNKGGAITEEMEIPKEMCYKFDYLLEKRAKKVSGTISSSGGETHTHNWTDTSEYIEELKDGDLIALYQIDTERFLILGRVVI